jgi:hypothetical protein
MLIHQIPPKPAYFRVKVGRRLQRLGAVAIKNSVYVLPRSESALEDLQWVLREIVRDGGSASLCETRFVDGLTDDQIESLFHAARNADYAELAEDGGRLSRQSPVDGDLDQRAQRQIEADVARLKRRLDEIGAIDFFGARDRKLAAGSILRLEARLRPDQESRRAETAIRPEEYRGRTWVTRKGIHVDRMASGWLIRRFIDAKARFKFVPAKDYRPGPGELRFDMFEAEFTHQGDLCTLEVLLDRFRLDDPGLRAIAEIVHDIDLKDARFARLEALGLERLIAGLAMAHKEDELRLERACAVFDDLYAYFKRKAPQREKEG